MTRDEENEYRRASAALIVAAMLTNKTPPSPPEDAPPEATETELAHHAAKRAEYEHKINSEAASVAMFGFVFAAALCSESVIWEGPQDANGEPLDARALDRECLHGKKMSEPCDACDADARERAAAASVGLGNAGRAENSDGGGGN